MLKPQSITTLRIWDPWVPESITRFTEDIHMIIWEIVVILEVGVSSITFLPERWGHVLWCIINGVELFHSMFGDIQKPKGGMPYMFPNAGPLKGEQKDRSWFSLAQHGFWRLSRWELQDDKTWAQRLVFDSTPDYPFSWTVDHSIIINNDWSIIFNQKIENTWSKDLPVSTGLHPYFNIPLWDKSKIEWRFNGWEAVKNDIDIWSEWGTWSYNIPDERKIKFYIPDVWEVCLELSRDYKKFWVWSLPDKNFVCVEPVMGDEWTIVRNPVLIAPGGINTNFMKVSLNK